MNVRMTTSLGDILLELNPEKAPATVENFISYVKSGHYDGTLFHRVIEDFMIQGGGLDQDMQDKPTNASIQNEADNGLSNLDSTIAMARTGDRHFRRVYSFTQSSITSTFSMITSSTGTFSKPSREVVSTSSIFSTTSLPSITVPNTQ